MIVAYRYLLLTSRHFINFSKNAIEPNLAYIENYISAIVKGLYHLAAFLQFVDRLTERRAASNPFHNLDLLFCQPVKLVDQGVYLMVGGLYLDAAPSFTGIERGDNTP
jgi:hypothetical protein